MDVGCAEALTMKDDEPMFAVRSSHLNTGLRGVPVGTCRTSFVTPNEGVHYCGYPIGELAQHSPEDIVFLLFNKELPTPEQSTAFKADLARRGRVPDSLAAVFHTPTLSASTPSSSPSVLLS